MISTAERIDLVSVAFRRADSLFAIAREDLNRELVRGLGKKVADLGGRGLLNTTVAVNERREVLREFLRQLLESRVTTIVSAFEDASIPIDPSTIARASEEIDRICRNWLSEQRAHRAHGWLPREPQDYQVALQRDMARERVRATTLLLAEVDRLTLRSLAETDVKRLADELERLREAVIDHLPDADDLIAAVCHAHRAAEQGEENKAAEHLKRLDKARGQTLLTLAKEVGVKVASEVITRLLGT